MNKIQRGFTLLETLLVCFAITAIGLGGYYVWHAHLAKKTENASSSYKHSNEQSAKRTVTDPTADWIQYLASDKKISLKYPKTWAVATHPELCSPGILLLGANSQSVGTCGSENIGQISVTWQPSHVGCGDLSSNLWSVTSKDDFFVDGVKGLKQQATAKMPAEGPAIEPEGTPVVNYCFYTTGYMYVLNYAKITTYPDVLNDFELMVVKTLHFSS